MTIYESSYFLICLLAKTTPLIVILRYDVIHVILLKKTLVHVDELENGYKWCHL